ncbi:MAG: patatin-like phospholipase family protein [Nitrospira sp.]
MAKIAIALSGGGYRASLFGLGVLLYLVDAQKNREVTSIASVSGGSITNAYIAQIKGYQKRESLDFWESIRPLVHTIAHKTLWAAPLTWVYLLTVLSFFFAIVYGSFCGNDWNGLIQWLVFCGLLLPWGWLFQQRGVIAGRAFGSNLFSTCGKPIALNEIDHTIDHVLCSTHLNAGEHFYFSGRFVYSYRFGWGQPGCLPLHAAVQASAAFPGGFPPRWMRTRRFQFQGGEQQPDPIPSMVMLVDGGVYDNMADQWPSGVARRAKARPDLQLQIPDQLIVVNSSAGLSWSYLHLLKVPLIGEFLSLVRDISVMFDNAASLRMKELVQNFYHSEDLRGVLVNIAQSPFKIPRAFLKGETAEAQRARAVMEKLGDEKEWDRITREDMNVSTTLSKVGARASAQLMRHGYALAMVNCHVILNFPLHELPELQRFQQLAS